MPMGHLQQVLGLGHRVPDREQGPNRVLHCTAQSVHGVTRNQVAAAVREGAMGCFHTC
jgi:hypothetical protein